MIYNGRLPAIIQSDHQNVDLLLFDFQHVGQLIEETHDGWWIACSLPALDTRTQTRIGGFGLAANRCQGRRFTRLPSMTVCVDRMQRISNATARTIRNPNDIDHTYRPPFRTYIACPSMSSCKFPPGMLQWFAMGYVDLLFPTLYIHRYR